MNSALLLTLAWTFTAVCQAGDDVSVSCDDVTGSVGEEVTFTCSVSLRRTECCIKMYKFQYPERVNDSVICKEELPEGSCDQSNIFTCRYTPATAMTDQFRFFVQTPCVPKTTEFTVNITDEAPKEADAFEYVATTSLPDTSSKHAAIAAAVSSLIIVLLIIIMTIISKTKPNFTKPCGFKHDEENTTPPEDPAAQDLMR